MNTNPDPLLFDTYERLQSTHRVQVTEHNINELAKHFGWSVSYAGPSRKPRLWKPDAHTVDLGAWIDANGTSRGDEPGAAGWYPEGTFTAEVVTAGTRAGAQA